MADGGIVRITSGPGSTQDLLLPTRRGYATRLFAVEFDARQRTEAERTQSLGESVNLQSLRNGLFVGVEVDHALFVAAGDGHEKDVGRAHQRFGHIEPTVVAGRRVDEAVEPFFDVLVLEDQRAGIANTGIGANDPFLEGDHCIELFECRARGVLPRDDPVC